jgi:hypothetical protein
LPEKDAPLVGFKTGSQRWILESNQPFNGSSAMSFKWKWLLTTFLAQLLLGGIFAGIQYWHMGNLAQARAAKEQGKFSLGGGAFVANFKRLLHAGSIVCGSRTSTSVQACRRLG